MWQWYRRCGNVMTSPTMRRGLWVMASSRSHLITLIIHPVGIADWRKWNSTILVYAPLASSAQENESRPSYSPVIKYVHASVSGVDLIKGVMRMRRGSSSHLTPLSIFRLGSTSRRKYRFTCGLSSSGIIFILLFIKIRSFVPEILYGRNCNS
jgi:hypothetical protein